MAEEDYYALLGVGRNATDEEVKRAYLRLARELHPDRHAGTPTEAEANEERFKLVNRAYETLKDPERRRQYDMFGADGERMADPFGGFAGGGLGDIFDAFFGGGPFGARGPTRRAGPPQGENVEGVLEISFAEAVLGTQKDVTIRAATPCETCSGSGARPGTTPVTCTTCNGAGELRRVRQSLLGQMVTSSPCPRCGGTGEEIASPCSDCRGQGRRTEEHSYTVDVPAGVDDGSTLRLTGRGAAGHAEARPVTSICTCACSPIRPSPVTATTCGPSCRSRWPRPRWVPRSKSRPSTARRRSQLLPGARTARRCACGAAVYPTCSDGAGATCW